MSKKKQRVLPLIYSCSGCSNIAQLSNQVAVELDREQYAEMSCIAGVGGGVASIVNKAKSGRPIIAIDGCALHCVKQCLTQHNLEATAHYTLTDYGIKKKYHMAFSARDVIYVKNKVITDLEHIDTADSLS